MLTHGFTNLVEACDDGRHRELSLEGLNFSIYHRLSFAHDDGGGGHFGDVEPVPDLELSAVEMTARFMDTRRYHHTVATTGSFRSWRDRPGSYTGGQVPYGALIRTSGHVEQTLALTDHGPHARRWSSRGFGIVVIGDFRKHEPTVEQLCAAIELGALLFAAYGLKPRGHTELPGASADPTKECPGKLFCMEELRARVVEHPSAQLVVSDARLALGAFQIR